VGSLPSLRPPISFGSVGVSTVFSVVFGGDAGEGVFFVSGMIPPCGNEHLIHAYIAL
jgi:hypothetical protein